MSLVTEKKGKQTVTWFLFLNVTEIDFYQLVL